MLDKKTGSFIKSDSTVGLSFVSLFASLLLFSREFILL
ncbi:hypothetical protein YPPY14_0834 [Yersinia pestis PY-14]|nr:hypothetical protein YpUG050454_0701 [Yersinia pestis biovar Antiqua str. UG05-0454]EIR54659.1 hypothetical protein YPPY14_0834 [Yersinia pestis PY-14]